MNEPAFADRIRRVLEVELDHLPEHVTTRLATARSAALARLPAPVPAGVAPPRAPARGPAEPPRARAAARPLAPATPGAQASGGWLRWLPAPLATALFAGCLLAVWHWSDLRSAEEIAALDVAILADDVPLAAYADKGFGVYLRNTR